MELRFTGSDNDFLVYGFTSDFLLENPWLYEMGLEAFFPLAQKHNLVVVQAHPFRAGCTPVSPSLINGVEVFNGNPRHNSHNEKAAQWAHENKLIETSGTDFHEPGDCIGTGIVFLEPIQSEKQLAEYLLNRAYL
jgi:hypothetical protein